MAKGDIRLRVGLEGARQASRQATDVSESVEQIGRSAEDAASRSAKLTKLEDRLERVATAGRRAADIGDRLSSTLTVAVAAGFGGATKAASDLGEAVNLTGRIFKDQSAQISRAAERSADAVGLSERAYRESTAALGGLLQNLDFTQDETVSWSQRLVTVGADLGSAFNTDPADAVEAIGSALRGETEPIRRYNVMLSDAEVRIRAVEMGLAASTSEVDANAKAQATLTLITEQTAAVQGDFADTADGLANKSRTLKARLEDVAAQMGENLLPLAESSLQFIDGLVTSFGDLSPEIQQTIIVLGAAAAAIGPLMSVGGRLVASLGQIKTAATTAYAALGTVGALTMGAAVIGIGLLVNELFKAKVAARELADEVLDDVGDDAADRMNALNAALAQQIELRGDVGDRLSGIFNVPETTREIAAVEELEGRITDLREEVELAAYGGRLFGDHQEAMNYYLDQGYDSATAMAAASMEMAQAADYVTTATDGWTNQLVAADEATQNATGSLQDVRAQLAGAETDTAQFGQGVEEYVRLPIEALGETLRGFSDPVGAYSSLLADKEQAERDAATATAAATASTTDSWEDFYSDVTVSASEWITQLETQATAQAEWSTNMQLLASRVSQTTLDQLARMGPEGAPLVADLVNQADTELSRLDDVFAMQADNAIGAVESRIQGARDVATRFGAETVAAMNAQLETGVLTAAQIAARYVLALQTGVNPLLLALGKKSITSAAGISTPANYGAPMAAGGPVPGRIDRTGADDVNARLTRGEWVMPVNARLRYGDDFMRGVQTGHYSPAAEESALRADGRAMGGPGGYAVGRSAPLPARLAGQSTIAALQGLARRFGGTPGSSYRSGSSTYHGKGQALDITGPFMKVWQGFAGMGARLKELIYTGAPYWILNGRRRQPYPGRLWNTHKDHVHVAATLASLGLPAGAAGGGDGFGFPTIDLPDVPDHPFSSFIGDPLTGIMEQALAAAQDFADNAFESAAPGVGDGVGRWAPVVNQALGMLGQSQGLAPWVLKLIQHESGGNPRAINLTDINARRGDPSRGLIQAIGSTFRAYRHPDLPNDVTHPLANIFAGLNYGISRYGSIANIPGIRSLMAGGNYRPYADGGLLHGFGLVGEEGPELISSQTRPLRVYDNDTTRGLLAGGGAGGGIGEVHLHIETTGKGPDEGDDAFARRLMAEIRNNPDVIEQFQRELVVAGRSR